MESLDVLTLNEEKSDREKVIQIVWEAIDYFPTELWITVNYLGNITLKPHLEIRLNEFIHKAFIVNKLMMELRRIKQRNKSTNLLLVLTHDPIIITYYHLQEDGFNRIVKLVRDYVTGSAGMVSLFMIDEKTGKKITAHGLGHHQGLEHHLQPLDLMYVRLLNGTPIEEKGFCDNCQKKLEKRINS
ncbi:MAG: hypothetical protein ACLFVP_09965 [Candidatus Bathyarchaeia archaeon]